MNEQSTTSSPIVPGQTGRAPYHKPELYQFGRLMQLTTGPTGGTLDMLAGGVGGFEDQFS